MLTESLPSRRRVSRFVPWLLAALAACAAGGPATGAPPHLATETITITAAGLLPGELVHIPAFGTVVFKNALGAGDVVVAVARPFAPSAACSTSLGFGGTGADSTSQPIPPQGVATLCFHDAGAFPFVIRSPAGEQRGTIEVGGGQ